MRRSIETFAQIKLQVQSEHHVTISVMGARHLEVLSPNAQAEHGTTPLQQACNIADDFGIKCDETLVPECLERIRYLISLGADVNQRNANGRNAIMGGCIYRSIPFGRVINK